MKSTAMHSAMERGEREDGSSPRGPHRAGGTYGRAPRGVGAGSERSTEHCTSCAQTRARGGSVGWRVAERALKQMHKVDVGTLSAVDESAGGGCRDEANFIKNCRIGLSHRIVAFECATQATRSGTLAWDGLAHDEYHISRSIIYRTHTAPTRTGQENKNILFLSAPENHRQTRERSWHQRSAILLKKAGCCSNGKWKRHNLRAS